MILEKNAKINKFKNYNKNFPKIKTNMYPYKIMNSLNLSELKKRSLEEIRDWAKINDIDVCKLFWKQDIIFTIIKWNAKNNGITLGSGVLEIFPEGYGFLRTSSYNYKPSSDDIYVAPSQIRIYSLRTGDIIVGKIRIPSEKERYYSLVKPDTINSESFLKYRCQISFDNLTPLYPHEKFQLETVSEAYSTRIIDLIAPIGKGQRSLIVSPPKAGKTVLMQDIANAIITNHPEVELIVLLLEVR